MKRPIYVHLSDTCRREGTHRLVMGGKKRTYFDDGSVEITEFDTLAYEWPRPEKSKWPALLYTLAVLALLAWMVTRIPGI